MSHISICLESTFVLDYLLLLLLRLYLLKTVLVSQQNGNKYTEISHILPPSTHALPPCLSTSSARITQYVAFSDYLVSLANTHLRFLQVSTE